MACVGTFNLTGNYCIFKGTQLQFTARITGVNISGATFDSPIVRDFDKTVIANFSHEITNSGIGEVTYTLPASVSSGIDYAKSSWKSVVYPTGSSGVPTAILTGIVNVHI